MNWRRDASLSLFLSRKPLSLSSFIVMTINRSLIFQPRLFHKKRKGWEGNWKLTFKSETMRLEVNRGRLHTSACNSKLELQLRRCQMSFGLKTLARCSLVALTSASIQPGSVAGACKSSRWTATLLDVHASDQLGDGCYCLNSGRHKPWRSVATNKRSTQVMQRRLRTLMLQKFSDQNSVILRLRVRITWPAKTFSLKLFIFVS